MIRGAAVALLAVSFTGCGSGPHASGMATLWVTRNRGAHLLLSQRVHAGVSALEALRRSAKVTTSYGGRFVQSIDGLSGDLAGRRDWFYFVNGYEADRGAADYTLHPGDVEWWDYRSWTKELRVPIVVGAFPEPFLHGYDGKRRLNVVVTTGAHGPLAFVAHLLGARILNPNAHVPRGANLLYLDFSGTRTEFKARLRGPDESAGAPVEVRYVGNRGELLRGKFRYRYEVP